MIIGGGPAGLTAAIYARRAGKTALIIEKDAFGGQITYSPKVENIPGFSEITGNEFAEKLVDQALRLGVDFEACQALSIQDGPCKTILTDGESFVGRTVIIATGARHRLLGLPGEENLIGQGISFCAVCDGAFYQDKTVAVVGGGNSALQEALLLSDLAKKVYVIQNLAFLTGEKMLSEQLCSKPNVEIFYETLVDSLIGDSELKGIMLRRTTGGDLQALSLDGLFIAIGLVPQNEPFTQVLSLDSQGYADVDESCSSSVAGIFVAGDCRRKKIRQVTTAAADGAIAALAACDFIDRQAT